jgi:Flp pilus assembly protein TadG
LQRFHGDRGSAVAEFAMISLLLVILLFAVLQVAGVFFVKSIVASAAADGARHAASDSADSSVGGARATQLIADALSPDLASGIPCEGRTTVDLATGLATATVTCRGEIRSVFLPIGTFVTIDVTGQSLRERQP